MASTKLQVVDLGSSLVKAAIGVSSTAGLLDVEAVRVDPAPAGWDGSTGDPLALEPALSDLASTFFHRREPVHVTCGERLLRTCVWPLASVPASSVEDWLRSSGTTFVESFGARRTGRAHSTAMRRDGRGDHVDLTAIHSHATDEALELLVTMFDRAGLRFGGLYSPILTYAALVKGLPGTPPQMLVEVGYTSTRLCLFEEGVPAGYKVVYFGVEDLEGALKDEEEGTRELSSVQLFHTVRVAGSRHVDESLAGLLTALGPALRELTKPRPGEMDFELDEYPEPPSDGPLVTGPVGLLGSLTSWSDISARFETSLDAPCASLDPWLITHRRPKETPADYGAILGGALGLLKVVAAQDRETLNVAGPFLAARASLAPPPEPVSRIVTRLLLVSALAVFTVVLGLAGYAYTLRGTLREMARRRESEVRAIPDVKEVIRIVQGYRTVRTRYVVARTRARYLQDLLTRCPDWPGTFELLHSALPATGLAVTGVAFEVSWPHANLQQATQGAEAKSLRFRIDCESERSETGTQLSKSLLQVGGFTRVEPPENKLAGGSPRELQTYRITIAGEVDLEASRP